MTVFKSIVKRKKMTVAHQVSIVHDQYLPVDTVSWIETRFVKVVFCKRISKEQWGCHTSFVWQPLHNLMLMRN